jgi:ribulose-5-phosphate 4-epimerase/fuculose-1-phosphate aldolase
MLKQFQKMTWKIVDLVNPPTKTQRITRNAIVSRVILKEFVEVVNRMDQKGLLAGTLGEVSLRTSEGRFLITPGDKPISRITEDALCIAAIEKGSGIRDENFPSHTQWHREIYKNTHSRAVMLCQPPYATILANKLQKPEKGLLKDADLLLESIELVMANDVEKKDQWKDEGTCFIQSIGVLLWSTSLDDLFNRVEILERLSMLSLFGK